jgi:hypothetical protein
MAGAVGYLRSEMSDAAPQAGWWMASDGRWYPPEQHPSRNTAPQAGWWMASDGRWYPPEQHPSFRQPAPSFTGAPPSQTPPSLTGGPLSQTPPSLTGAPLSQTAPSFTSAPLSQPPTGVDPGWENAVGSGERKGLRTERSALNYFVRSSLLLLWFGALLVGAIVRPQSLWLWIPGLTIGVPVMGRRSFTMFTYRYVKRVWDEARKRIGYSQAGVGWAKESARGVVMLRASVVLAVVAVTCGLIGDLLLVKAQFLSGGSGGSNPVAPIVRNLQNLTTTTTSGAGGNPMQSQINQYENQQQQTQQTIDNLMKQLGG